MPEPGDKKNPVEEAMEKDCIILVAAALIAPAEISITSVKCRGPACAQYNVAFNRCGLM